MASIDSELEEKVNQESKLYRELILIAWCDLLELGQESLQFNPLLMPHQPLSFPFVQYKKLMLTLCCAQCAACPTTGTSK